MRRTFAAPAFSHFHNDWHLAPGVDTRDFAFLSGVTGYRPDGTVADDPEEQFTDAFKFLEQTLLAGELALSDIVEMTTYHVGLRAHIDTFIKVKDRFIFEPYPAWSCIGTTELITEGTLVEIRVICQRATHD